jgi:hypothetical protein
MKRPWIWISIVLVIFFGFYLRKKLTVYRELLGEVTFYKDKDLELKVVKIFENLPLHYVGNHWSVACKSVKTATKPEWKFDLIEAGWNRAPYSTYLIDSGRNDDSIEAVAAAAKKAYYREKDVFIILSGTGIHFSFDLCYSFVGWDALQNFPKEIEVSPTPEYEKCLKQTGLKNPQTCDYFNFAQANQPTFDEIVAENGKISFRMTAKALKAPLKITSQDFGKTWQVNPY